MVNLLALEKFWLKITRVGIFLVLLTPLVLYPFTFSPVGFAKTVFFRVLIEIIFVFYILLLLTNPRYRPKVGPVFVVVLIFFGILGLSTLTGLNPYRSFWGSLNRNEGFIFYLHLLIFFLILGSVFREKRDWLKILQFSVGVSFLVSISAILQKVTNLTFFGTAGPSVGRVTGTLGNPDFLAPYLVLNIFLALFLLATNKEKKWKKFALSGITLLNFYILILAGSRGAWLGAAFGFLLLLIYCFPAILKVLTSKKIFVFLILLVFLFSSFVVFNQKRFGFIEENYIISRFAPVLAGGGLGIRPALWDVALRAWRERPILGWGLEMYAYNYDRLFKADYFRYEDLERISYDRSHSVVFDTLASAGILGLLSYIAIFITTFFVIFNYKSVFKRFGRTVLFALLMGYFVLNLFIFDSVSSYLMFFLILGFINNNFVRNYE